MNPRTSRAQVRAGRDLPNLIRRSPDVYVSKAPGNQPA